MNTRTQFNLYSTPPHECTYLSRRQATTVFIDPHFPKDAHLYNILSQHGFRRSGEHLYRPHCQACQACLAVRIPVKQFKMRRSQKRVFQKNQDITVKAVRSGFKQEHFELYSRYLEHRHRGGGMDNPSTDSYLQFLTSLWANTIFYEFRLKEQLVAVAVVDIYEDAFSAIYTFFDPDYPQRSLGVFAILWEIHEAIRHGMNYVYLGYFIKECRKMNYKTEYRPLEYYHEGVWSLLDVDTLD